MQRMIPNLWFNRNAAEATAFYTGVLPDTRVTETVRYPHEGLLDFQQEFAGQELTVEFEVAGYRFLAINAGPEFRPNPALSFILNFAPGPETDARERLDATYAALAADGRELLPLGTYDFAGRYGWVEDRYGVSWQLMLADVDAPPVIPSLLFGGPVQNQAAAAIEHYTAVFPGARLGNLARYPEPTGSAAAGGVMFAELELFGQRLALMDAGAPQEGTFTPGVSLMVIAEDQAELDHYWEALSAVPEAEQCGWLVDRFGVSWQVVPRNLPELMQRPGAYPKLMAMKKIEIAAF